MCLQWTALKRSFKDCWMLTVEVFTTGKWDGFKRSFLLVGTCCIFSLILSSLLLLYLLYTLDYDLTVSGGVAACFALLFTVSLFLSKRVRCIGTLFFISIFMMKSRTLLLTAGTTLVVLRNICNTVENLTGLARSLICNSRAEKEAITSPFNNFEKMITWVKNKVNNVDFFVVKVDFNLELLHNLDLQKLHESLNQAGRRLNETVRYTQTIMNVVTSVASRAFPAISFLILLTFIILHVKKYCTKMNFNNKFITSKFVSFDEKEKAEGRPYVLPLTPEEGKLYTRVQFVRPTSEEGKAMLKFCVPIIFHLVAWTIFITVDALLYLFVDTVTMRLSEVEPLYVPFSISFKKTTKIVEIQSHEENHRKDFSYNITLFEKKCLPNPKLQLFNSITPLVVILLMLSIMAIVAGKLSHIHLMVCERFFPEAAEQRVEHLHAKILRNRRERNEKDSESSSSAHVSHTPSRILVLPT